MATITIPRKITKGEELIIVPRKEYEEFSQWRGVIKTFKTFSPTPAQKRALREAREDYKKGKYVSLNELKRQLGIKD
jgi:hypothetical protein